MIVFTYNRGYSKDVLSEERIKEKYKDIETAFPTEQIVFNWLGERWSISASDTVLHAMNVFDNEFNNRVHDGLNGMWELEHDEPIQYLHFIRPLYNDERGIVILANSPDFVLNRQQLEYDFIFVDKDNAFLNFFVNTSNQVIQFRMHLLNSHTPSLQLDDATGKMLHYKKFQNP